MKQRIFISYSWKDGNKYADELEKQLQDDFDVIRDKSKLTVNDDIEDFMRGIADCDIVVLILSQEYTKSENCMKELVYLVDQPDWKDKAMLLIIDTELYNVNHQDDIVEYWNEQLRQSSEKLNEMQRKTQNRKNQVECYKNICNHLDSFFVELKKRNNPSQIAIVKEIYKLSKRDKTKELKVISRERLLVKKALEECGDMTISDLSEKININEAVVKRYISQLTNSGDIIMVGTQRKAKWKIK